MWIDSIWLWIGILFIFQWITIKWADGNLFIRKQEREHYCMNQMMEGTYDCVYCYPEDYEPPKKPKQITPSMRNLK